MFDEAEDLLGAPIPYISDIADQRRGRGRPKGSPNTSTLIKNRGDARTRKLTDGKKLNYSHTPDREALIVEAEETKALGGDAGSSVRISHVMNGVPIPFLSHVFRKTAHITKERLRSVTPIRIGKNGALFYDLYEAAEVLVDPKVDISAYLKNVRLEDLPLHLQENYWNIKKKRKAHEEDSYDLWRTQDVRETLGDMFKIIRNRLQLFPDSMDDRSPLSPEHRRHLRTLLNSLQAEIRDDLLRNMQNRKTPSSASDLEGIPDV